VIELAEILAFILNEKLQDSRQEIVIRFHRRSLAARW
jgi:hypothetical protein